MYQKLIENIIYPMSDKLLGLSINRDLKKNKHLQWLEWEEVNSIQIKKLYKILNHCNENIPYYQKILQKHSFDFNGDIYQELKKIPFLTKHIIRKNLPDGLIDKKRKIYTIEKTSGSTGE